MPKRVTQVHFTAWPDKTVPGIAWHLVNVWRKVKTLNENKLGPTVVHCRYHIFLTSVDINRLLYWFKT